MSQIYTKNFVNIHDCSINYEKSPGSMEFSRIIDCFTTFETKLNFRYSDYIEDGNPRTRSEVVKKDCYTELTVQKLSCVGHLQKIEKVKIEKYRENQTIRR